MANASKGADAKLWVFGHVASLPRATMIAKLPKEAQICVVKAEW